MPTQTQTPNFFPFTRYADANGAIKWLSRAFGFNERVAYRGDDGEATHEAVFSAGCRPPVYREDAKGGRVQSPRCLPR